MDLVNVNNQITPGTHPFDESVGVDRGDDAQSDPCQSSNQHNHLDHQLSVKVSGGISKA
jgi:hypothetical protein